MKSIKKCFAPYMGLPMSIYVIFFASIVNSLGNLVGPFLTLFLTYKLGIDIGLVGTIVAVNAGLGMIGAMIGGKLVDQIGRKKVLVLFGTLSGLGYAICAFTQNPIAVISILMFSSFVGGFSQPVYSTIVMDLTEGEQRKAAFSLNYMAMNIGFSVGPLVAGFLYKNYIMWLFLGDALTTLLSIALVGLFVDETIHMKGASRKSNAKNAEVAEEGSLLSALLKRPQLLMFSFIIVIYFIVFSQFTFGLSLQAEDTFKENGSAIFGSLMTVNAIMCSTLTVFITSALKKIKPSLCIAFGGILYAIGFGMIFFIHSYIMFILSAAIWTTGEILVATNTSVYIADNTPMSHRGRFNAVFPIIRRIGFMLGPIFAGVYVRYSNVRNLWLFIGALSIIGALMMYKLYTVDNIDNARNQDQAI